MLQGRALAQVAAGREVDVLWTMTTAEREATLLPIRIPIDRGLLGWRLLLVREADLPRFAQLRTAGQLRRLVAGQGHDWPDTAILRHSGYRVETTAVYTDLFHRLASGRIAYFPRSVQEVWRELERHPGQRFAVEPTLALHYPVAMYFFVNRATPPLPRP